MISRYFLTALVLVWCTPAWASFAYRGGPFTVQSGKMPSSQTNFPFCIYWTNSALKTTANGGQVTDAQGNDIVPYSDSALTVRYNDFEMVSYNGATGTIEMCVRASGGVGTTIYLGIGDAGITTFQGNAAAAWESNFKVVYHFGDGTTLSASDSTANSSDGNVTGATATAGKVGGGAWFSGGSDNINSGDVANANFGTEAFTISFWLKTTSPDNYVAGKRAVCNHDSFWNMGLTSGALYLEIDEDSSGTNYGGAYASNAVNDNAWHYLVATRTGPLVTLYVDGANAASGSTPGTTNLTNAGSLLLGNSPCGWPLAGHLDEFRISKGIERSADWIASEYNNMADMMAFWGSPSFAPVQAGPSRKEYIYLGERVIAVETSNQ